MIEIWDTTYGMFDQEEKRIFTKYLLCTGYSARHFHPLPHLFFTITLLKKN